MLAVLQLQAGAMHYVVPYAACNSSTGKYWSSLLYRAFCETPHAVSGVVLFQTLCITVTIICSRLVE